MLAQEPVAEGVERGDLDVGVAVRHERVDTLFHLRRGLVGERERQDLVGARDTARDEGRDASGDDGGLAGAGAGDDEQGALVVSDGRALRLVQAVQDAVARHAVCIAWRGAAMRGKPARFSDGRRVRRPEPPRHRRHSPVRYRPTSST